MATFATQDDLNALAQLVRTLQDDITTLDTSVGEIDTLIEKINHVEALKDITLTYVTEGDVLQFSSDGTWHNVQPAALNMGFGDGEGSPVDSAIVKSLILTEGGKLFLSKLYDDTAAGQITFLNGLVCKDMAYFREGIEIGNYTPGFLGSGAKIDKNGYAEMSGLTLREFLEVPELRFNRIDVVSGELWNSIAFGTIESVDTVSQIATIKLEEGEYSGLHINDICRGIFHNIDGYNNTETGIDDCGFERMQGFSTAYFTPTEIIGDRGEKFRYVLKTGTTQHPCPSMKFAVYGNFIDEDRQNSAYSTKTYKRFLKGVNTWTINQTLNVASLFGDLSNLKIEGAPNNGQLQGNGAYLSNVYMTDALIQFKPDQEAALKGKDGYSVNLDHYSASVLVDNNYNIINLEAQKKELTFAVQAFKGSTELIYDNVYGEGKYFADYTPVGCEVSFNNGVFTITNITGVLECYISILINCEGETIIKQTFTIVPLLEPNSLWVTYHDNDALPPIPTGDGTLDGWHRNYTSTATWMSTKSNRDINEGEWGDPVRFRGASVAGEDGQYTAFAYTISSVQPETPTQNSGLPPKDPAGIYTWSMSTPKRENLNQYTWMSQCIVYGDKTQSGWSEPIRLTGDDGVDGTDGKDLEFIYGLFNPGKYMMNDGKTEVTLDRPWTPSSEQKDDAIPGVNSSGENPADNVVWDDNPHGVSELKQYEWVCQRTKEAGPHGTMKWSEWSAPVIWSKWGEKGMDGDGYEYIYTRTTDVDVIPDQPKYTGTNDKEQQDEYYPPVTINGVATGYKWTDDPTGLVSETYKAEWVCKRKKTDKVWSNFSKPALWSNWGEQGMQGAHYIYRWCLSATTPSYNANNTNPGSGWVNNSELQAEGDKFVWQIQCLSNPDGSQGTWGNLIRITGANGKDGEDGNSIEFLYARNNTGISPSAPPTNQITDWEGSASDTNNNTTITWYDNPQGVTANIMYEYVCQRYFNKATQKWEAYSTPGIWARYSEKGKDGDGFEYIYRRFGAYQSQAPVSHGGAYYPDTSSSDYQNDDYVPANYTDNPVGPTTDLPYEYVWTRKKKQGTWGVWSDGAMWSRWSKDGEKGDKGDTGATGPAGSNGSNGQDGADGVDGKTYVVNGCPGSIRSSLTYLLTTSVKLNAVSIAGSSTTTSAAYGYWAAYRKASDGTWYLMSRQTSASSSFTVTWDVELNAKEFWFGFSTDPVDANSLSPTYTYKVWDQFVPVVYDGDSADSGYTIMRDRGWWSTGISYYNDMATSVMDSSEYTNYQNYQNLKVIDYVQYEGEVYYCLKNTSSAQPSSSSSYWKKTSKMAALSVNTLLANNAKLGDFNYSNYMFTSSSGNLSMNSRTGSITATQGLIAGFTLAASTLTSSSSGHKMTLSSSLGTTSSTAGIRFTDDNDALRLSLSSSSSPWINSYAGGQIYISSTANLTTQLSGASIYMTSSTGGSIWVDLNQSNWNCAYISISKLPSTTVSTTASGTVRWVSASLGGTTRKVLILA